MIQRRVLNLVVINLLVAGLGFFRNTIIRNRLVKADVGVYSLIFAFLIGYVSHTIIFGQDLSILRHLSTRRALARYNWKRVIDRTLLIGLLLLLPLLAVFKVVSAVDSLIVTLTGCVVYSVAVTTLSSAILRSQGRYELSRLMEQSPLITLGILTGLLFVVGRIGLYPLFYSYALISPVVATIVFPYVRRTVPCGSEESLPGFVGDGILLAFLNFLCALIASIDQFFIARMLSYEHLAVYSSVLYVFFLVTLMSSSIRYVLIAHAASAQTVRIGTYLLQVSLLGVLVFALYNLLGRYFVHFLYAGRYDDGLFLIPLFSMVAFLRIYHAVPDAIMSGRSERDVLWLNVKVTLLALLLGAIACPVLIIHWSLAGAAMALVLTYLVRAVGISYLLVKHRQAVLAGGVR